MGHLNKEIKKQQEKFGIKIVYRKAKTKGEAIVAIKTIVINENLSKKEQEQIILHEIEHIKNHHSLNSIESPINKIKKEAEAEHGRIEANIKYYLNHTPEEYWNTFEFASYFGITSEYENFIEDQLKSYLPSPDKKEYKD